MSLPSYQIGSLIKVSTTYDETIVGEVFCYDKNVNVLVLNILKLDSSEDYDIVMLKADYISDVDILQKGSLVDIVLPDVSYSQIGKKEKTIEAEMRNRTIPKTSPYGNYVFAYVSKHLACQWNNGDIVIGNNIRITAPYGKDNITGDEKGVDEVKKLLEKMK